MTQAIFKAIEIVTISDSALVTGPICKKSWSLAGHEFSGQTDTIKSCGVKNGGMLFIKITSTGWRFNTLPTHSTEFPRLLGINPQ